MTPLTTILLYTSPDGHFIDIDRTSSVLILSRRLARDAQVVGIHYLLTDAPRAFQISNLRLSQPLDHTTFPAELDNFHTERFSRLGL
jgi:hypothetical protein